MMDALSQSPDMVNKNNKGIEFSDIITVTLTQEGADMINDMLGYESYTDGSQISAPLWKIMSYFKPFFTSSGTKPFTDLRKYDNKKKTHLKE